MRAGSEGAVLHARPTGRAAVAGGRTHHAEVWQDFNQSLLAFIARRVRDRDTAEDILQEVMLRIHRHAGDLEEPSAVAAWVHQIAATRSPTTTAAPPVGVSGRPASSSATTARSRSTRTTA